MFGRRRTLLLKVKVKWSRYRPGMAQRVGRGIALLFHDHGTRRGWVVSSTHRPLFTPGKDPVPILQEAGWAPGSVWMGGKSRPHRDSIPDRPARSQSLYRPNYPAHNSPLTTITLQYSNISSRRVPKKKVIYLEAKLNTGNIKVLKLEHSFERYEQLPETQKITFLTLFAC